MSEDNYYINIRKTNKDYVPIQIVILEFNSFEQDSSNQELYIIKIIKQRFKEFMNSKLYNNESNNINNVINNNNNNKYTDIDLEIKINNKDGKYIKDEHFYNQIKNIQYMKYFIDYQNNKFFIYINHENIGGGDYLHLGSYLFYGKTKFYYNSIYNDYNNSSYQDLLINFYS